MAKKIIIDGVDVSGCCWCNFEPDTEPYCEINDGEDLSCEDNPNCYYKQLKRKEQECEELKKQVCGLRPELKSMIDKICCKYNVEAKNYHEKIIEIINNLDKYKQALDEIRQYRVCEINDVDGEEDDVILGIIDEVMEP